MCPGPPEGSTQANISGKIHCPFAPSQFTPDLLEPQIRSGHLPKPHSHYKEFLDLRGDGRVVLYKRADHQNPKWTVRLKIPETDGFVVKSSKTTDDFEARRFAEDLYYRLEGKARRGEPINSPTFRRVFTEWSKVPVAEQVIRTARYVNGNVRRVEIWALQYFADTTIDKVTEAKLGGLRRLEALATEKTSHRDAQERTDGDTPAA